MSIGVPSDTPFIRSGRLDSACRLHVSRLREETMKVLRQPGVIEELTPQGSEPMLLTPAEFDEIEGNKATIKAAGLKFD